MKKALLIILLVQFVCCKKPSENIPPNVIVVLTDDLGIGDLECHGNPWLKTPAINAFYHQAVRMTDFHVSPYCTPTRAALMTGLYPINNGAWATFKGRDALSEHNITMADVFQQNGYKTGLFGKWHLGDNYPSRPTDSGFDVAVQHMSGGVGELSDYWGNSYFDDTYFVNNKPEQFEGYCTDVWFEQAMKFIKINKEKPFFTYIATNAPHSPLIVDEKYAAPYKQFEGSEIISANLLGMIANIDENFGKLYQFLEDENLMDHTILIFMSDNGTNYGYSRDGKLGYNKGYRGIKSNREDGGHMPPFFIRWPNGKIEGGKDIDELVSHVDLLPTLINMCDLDAPKKLDVDGIDFSPLLFDKPYEHKDRTVFIHAIQDWRQPSDTKKSCIMKGKWRLVNGKQLYDIGKDRMQRNNLAAQYPHIVKELLKENQKFLEDTKQRSEYKELPVHIIGSDKQKETKLTIQHAIGESKGIWKSEHIAAGLKNKNNKHVLKVQKKGEYLISCARWPKEAAGPILGIPSINPKQLFDYKTIRPEKIRIKIADQTFEKSIQPSDESINFKVRLEKGRTILENDFLEGEERYGIYYTYINYLGS